MYIRTITHNSYYAMISRCYSPKSAAYKKYGAVGIRVCKRWHKFENFLKDMGERPSKEFSINRKNPRKGYCPSNCEWATIEHQNKYRTNVPLYDGKSLAELARERGISEITFRGRRRMGWSIERILNTPVRRHSGHHGKN